MSDVMVAGDARVAGALSSHAPVAGPLVPKSLVCLREGLSRRQVVTDLVAGLTVAVIALPLALAFAIGSHVSPERGLYTAIIAGFLISLLGGSRVNIGGPTGAFVVIVAGVVDKYGYEGLVLATVMAGAIMVIMGLARFGGMIKFIPYPVTTGFTAGIALIIFSSQIKEFFGMQIAGQLPAEFVAQWEIYLKQFAARNVNFATLGVGALAFAIIVALRRFAPRLPSYLIAVAAATVVVALWGLDAGGVATINTRFGGIPASFPAPALPDFSKLGLEQARSLIPEATTIALLAAIESLLCAVVADGMIGGRHKSNCELIAQGAANVGSVMFGGIPATAAIARTAANVKAGARTPLAGVVHAVAVLGFMLLLAPLAGRIPLASLSAVLIVVAWGMSERDHFRSLLRAPRSDIAVLLTTFGLTVFASLTTAVMVGMVLAAMLFMKRMSEVTNVGVLREELEDDADGAGDDDPNSLSGRQVPEGVQVYEINGPFFFGVADRLKDALIGLERPPRVFVLRMRRVPAIDATGMHALDELQAKCARRGTVLLLAGVHAQPMFALAKFGLLERIGEDNLFGNVDDALNRARAILGLAPVPRPAQAQPEVARERT